ncbi:MAG: hypothetical protein LBT88_03360 [Oscillospiraceae bacterium]|jgi:hypothetical protein|nr:hypothetical protein [Oscillospiraceae bacterium]
MSLGDVFKIVLTAVGGIGGVAVIIGAVVKFSANHIAERLSAKYELQLNKELESFKSGLEKKNYVSKVRFDAEFDIYRQLSKSFADMVKSVYAMITPGLSDQPADENARKEKDEHVYRDANNKVVVAQDTLRSNAPFIPVAFYLLYDEILKLGSLQLYTFRQRWNIGSLETQSEKEHLERDDYKRSRKMNEKLMSLNDEVRKYLKKLDVSNENVSHND